MNSFDNISVFNILKIFFGKILFKIIFKSNVVLFLTLSELTLKPINLYYGNWKFRKCLCKFVAFCVDVKNIRQLSTQHKIK